MFETEQDRNGRIASGVPGFDDLIDGGLPPRRLYVISGPPGSGKTTFCSQFITQGVRNEEDCLYVTMHETKSELVADMSNFEFGFGKAMQSDRVRFLNLLKDGDKRTIAEYGSTGLKNRLSKFIEANDIDRAVVDSTMLLQHFMDDPENELTAFISLLKQTDATVLLISELTDPSSYSEEHFLSHGVVFFHNFREDGGMTRGVQIIKMRGTDIDCDIRGIGFSDRGLRVYPEEKVDG